MEAFNKLREQARKRHDLAVAEAKEQLTTTLTKIAVLEQDLLGQHPKDFVSIASAIDASVPVDRPFTTYDVMVALKALNPRRNWRPASIVFRIGQMRRIGLVKRIRRRQGKQLAQYVRIGVEREKGQFEDLRLVDVVEMMLAKYQPISQTELAVRMLEEGYQTTMSARSLRTQIGVVLREGDYRKCLNKWSCGKPEEQKTAPK